MKKSLFSYLTFYILLFSFITILYISIDSSFRRKIIGLSLGFFNNYYSITIQNSLVKENNLEKAVRKLERQIRISDFLTTESKNSFIDNVYVNAYKIEKFIKSDQDYKYFSNVIKKLIEKDPDIYSAIIWDAKLMKINDSKDEDVFKRIDQAINLSPSSLEAYRFALDYSYNLNKKKLFNKYCSLYSMSLLGAKHEKDNTSFFGSSSLSRFAIQITPTKEKQEIYLMEGISLNQENDYVFTLKTSKDLIGLNLISNFLPGTSIDLIGIDVINTENEKIKIPIETIYLSSKNSFFQKDEEKLKIIATSTNDELINIKLDKNYKNISKIIMKIKFSKLSLTNQDCK